MSPPIHLAQIAELRARIKALGGPGPAAYDPATRYREGQVDGLEQAIEVLTGRYDVVEGSHGAHALELLEHAIDYFDVGGDPLTVAEVRAALKLTQRLTIALAAQVIGDLATRDPGGAS